MRMLSCSEHLTIYIIMCDTYLDRIYEFYQLLVSLGVKTISDVRLGVLPHHFCFSKRWWLILGYFDASKVYFITTLQK